LKRAIIFCFVVVVCFIFFLILCVRFYAEWIWSVVKVRFGGGRI
jgi:hypothetical protein